MAKKPNPPAPAELGRIGRPPKPDAKTERTLVRHTAEEHATYQAEAERLTRLTGQGWTVSGYLRVAGAAYAGKHLAGGPVEAEPDNAATATRKRIGR